LKTQLELLVRLQSCDLAILKAQRIQENHPREIKDLKEALDKEQEAVRDQESRFEEVKKKRIAKEQDLALEEEKVQKAKQRLTAVKTNKEYQAALKEIEAIESQNSKIEEEILTIMEEADNLKISHEKTEEHFKLTEKETEEKKRELEKQIIECTQAIEEQQKMKEEFITQIKSEVLDLYQRIKQKRPELTVVAVENSCCLGCHMNIPPQLFNEVKKCQKIIVCPHCSRILYWTKNHETLSRTLQPEPQ
jgi:predicted  nucleic acid-binding Zn-ribbon protein